MSSAATAHAATAGLAPAAAEVAGAWKAATVGSRLRVVRAARHAMAANAQAFAEAMAPALARTHADTLVSEVLPLLDAMRFLERRAEGLLRVQKLGRKGRPFWLSGVSAEIRREPLGHVLVIGPSNFPLFLPGVQVVQALVAGNRVTWKPGTGGGAVANLMAAMLREAGLPEQALSVTDDSVAAGERALAEGADKVVFTGSREAGQSVLRGLAETATPAVMELSGVDAVLVLEGADLAQVARAVAYGLRLNGGAVCMSPRRVLGTARTLEGLRPLLLRELEQVPGVVLPERNAVALRAAVAEAQAVGAVMHGEVSTGAQRPVVLEGVSPGMTVVQTDLFAPLVSLIEVESEDAMPAAYEQCRFALTCAVFARRGDARAAELAGRVTAGVVLVNDIIAPTADPRLPFGGRRQSGFGVTRGAEGLLEMTAPKVVITRRGGRARHFDATTDADAPKFAALIRAVHGKGWRERMRGVRELVASGRNAG